MCAHTCSHGSHRDAITEALSVGESWTDTRALDGQAENTDFRAEESMQMGVEKRQAAGHCPRQVFGA